MSDQARIAALEAELAALRAEVASLRGASTPASPPPVAAHVASPAADTPTAATRRAVLRRAAAVAAGAGAATAFAASPAAAANGDAVTAGQITTATSKTELRYSSAGALQSHILAVQDGTFDLSFVFYPSAVLGMANSKVSNGVVGMSNVPDGAGMIALGSHDRSRGLLVGGDKAQVSIAAQGSAPQERNTIGGFVPGDIVFDSGYTMWLCVGSGATGGAAAWRRLSAPSAVGSLTLNASPIRAYDSRVTGGRIAAGQERDVPLKTGGGVPEGANAALLNVTVTDTSTAGFLKVFKPGAAVPSASNINWDHTGSNVANNATVVLDTEERCRIRCGGTSASTHFIVDVLGWYR